MKKFWKKSEGFTLVELIVVIAILGILAGVGTVGYSGYIKKANMAADQQLVAAINQAYAIACVENGVDAAKTTASNITIGDDKTVAAADIQVTDPAEKADAIEAAFAKYFAGNESAAFKVAETLNFKRDKGGVFEADFTEADTVEATYAGSKLSFSATDIANVNGSTFMNASTLGGASGLMNKVNDVTNFAAALTMGQGGAQFMDQVYQDSNFQKYLLDTFRIDTTGMTEAEIEEALDSKLIGFAQQINPDPNMAAESIAKVRANVAVMYAAQNAAKMDQDTVIALLSGDDAKGAILSTLDGTGANAKQDAFAQAALAYGMYTAFAHSSFGSQEAQNKSAFDAMMDLNNPQFKAYLADEQAKTDLQGYMSALNMINSGAKDSAAVDQMVVKGFNDTELVEALEGVLGNG